MTNSPTKSRQTQPYNDITKLDPRRERTSDAAGRGSKIYWTIKTSDAPPAAEWKITPLELPPHGNLCVFQFGTLKALVKCLEDKGWDRLALVNLAKVQVTKDGFQVRYFPTLADALAGQKMNSATI